MAYQNPKTKLLLVSVSVFLVIIKFFTAIVISKDDPTTLLVFKLRPSLNNNIFISSLTDNNNFFVLLSDENGFVGDTLYSLCTHYIWWLLPLLILIYMSFNIVLTKKNQLTLGNAVRFQRLFFIQIQYIVGVHRTPAKGI